MLRIWSVFFLFLVIFGVIIARLFYWQVVSAEDLQRKAASQYYLEFILPATRGDILASDGKPVVMNQPAYLVYAQPRLVKDVRTFANVVAPVLKKEAADIIGQLTIPDRVWVPLGRKVENKVAEELRGLKLTGLGFEKESKRYYPESSMAAQLVGFVGSDENGRDKGYFGLEGYYDRELRGKDGKIQLEKDVRGAPILVGEAKRVEPENGRSLLMWLDRVIQHSVEERLKQGLEKYGAKEGSVVVLDPKTGGVLAMASFPNYDPAAFGEFTKELYKNPAVAGSYEPGSTFKTLVMSGALEEKAVTPTTIVDESGPVTIGDYTIRTWNNQYHGPITTTKILEYSSNVGMVSVGRKLGKDRLLRYIHQFAFGIPTNIDLEDETSADLRPDKEWRDIDVATASFGQGIAVTPIQMARAVAALANDGWLMEPHTVKEVVDAKGNRVSIKPKKLKQVVGSAAAHVIAEMMVAAVDNGEAKWAKPKGYRIAGKTGTAQIPVAGHYDAKKTIASFVGFAPADDPKFVMLVTLREPTSSPWGSETAAPLFFTIAKDMFRYWGIPPQ
ncbi:penicillin-binding protein 2 [Candidatus Gottesmanbacteria bacterium]|nr:penicillin-binding protein 2 [Candidatus Gottesmanbacteria bacterium]